MEFVGYTDHHTDKNVADFIVYILYQVAGEASTGRRGFDSRRWCSMTTGFPLATMLSQDGHPRIYQNKRHNLSSKIRSVNHEASRPFTHYVLGAKRSGRSHI